MMKQTSLKPKFGPEIRFEVIPRINAPLRGHPEFQLDRLTRRLLQPHLASAHSAGRRRNLLRMAQEAASLAWLTPFPLLVLPELLAEKLAVLDRQLDFQSRLRRKCLPSNSEAA